MYADELPPQTTRPPAPGRRRAAVPSRGRAEPAEALPAQALPAQPGSARPGSARRGAAMSLLRGLGSLLCLCALRLPAPPAGPGAAARGLDVASYR